MASGHNHALLVDGEGHVYLLEHIGSETSIPEQQARAFEESRISDKQHAEGSPSETHNPRPEDIGLPGNDAMDEDLITCADATEEQSFTGLSKDRTATNKNSQAAVDQVWFKMFGMRALTLGQNHDEQVDTAPDLSDDYSDLDVDLNNLSVEELQASERLAKSVCKMLDCAIYLERQMTKYRDYIRTQDSKDVALYQWSQYKFYGAMHRETTDLDEAVQDVASRNGDIECHKYIPRRVVALFFKFAVQKSISISNTAQFALETMNRKTAACFGEVDKSSMSEAAKDMAKQGVTKDVAKLMKHTTESTRSVYAALDLLVKIFYHDLEKDYPNLVKVARPEPEEKKTSWSMWKVVSAGLVAILAMCGAAPYMLDGNKFSTDIHKVNIDKTAEMGQNALLANLTEFATRCKGLDDLQARLDNIAESLGPPNEQGMYMFQKDTDEDGKLSNIQLDDLQKRNQELSEELIQLRKHVHVVDIRLTKEVDRLKRKG